MNQDWVNKCLAKANAEDWDEVPRSQMAATIEYLKTKQSLTTNQGK